MSAQKSVAELVQAVRPHASHAFVKVLQTPYDDRHYVREETRKRLEEWGDDPEDLGNGLSGSFFTALWEGDIERARRAADDVNFKIMREAELV